MKTQRGISLIELMVSVALGLLLLLGLGTIFVSINQTSHLRRDLSELQNNERMAMIFLAAGIRNAGSYPMSGAVAAVDLSASAVVGTGTASAGTDTFSVSFVAASGVSANQGCSAPLTAGAIYTDKFSVKDAGTSKGYLQCEETTAGVTTTIPLVAGVQGMNVLYGVDPITGSNCTGSVANYLTAAQVTAATIWPTKTTGSCSSPFGGTQIKTITTVLIFTNPLAGQPGQLSNTVTLTQTIPYMNGL
jgi:type IV pilus assembly protein PilW